MKRLYQKVIQNHLQHYNQMLFLAGPRQVGKTTLAQIMLKNREGLYLNWDNPEDRALILGKYSEIISQLGPKKLGQEKPIIIFDEVHKYKNWKNHLKGFYDLHKNDCHIIVTALLQKFYEFQNWRCFY